MESPPAPGTGRAPPPSALCSSSFKSPPPGVAFTNLAQPFVRGPQHALALALRAGLTEEVTHVLTVREGWTFDAGWLDSLRSQLDALPPGAALSADLSSDASPSRLCGVVLPASPGGSPLSKPASLPLPLPPSPLPSHFSSSFSLLPLPAALAAPLDPFLPLPPPPADLAYTARLLSHGVEIYSPAALPLSPPATPRADAPPTHKDPARLNTLLQAGGGLGPEARALLGPYGLGALPIAALEAHLGVSFAEHRSSPPGFCDAVPPLPPLSGGIGDIAAEYTCAAPAAPPDCEAASDVAPVYPLLSSPPPRDGGGELPHPAARPGAARFEPGRGGVGAGYAAGGGGRELGLLAGVLLLVVVGGSVLRCVRELGRDRVSEERRRAIRSGGAIAWGGAKMV
ncbi:hypothetical protein TeGR_g2850 [Tetraparma gracilis]|uniref:Uncharacterized protein n=1 Tax=Tetraparma gracilis TaxID=2962635 RepID=A0ABQ6MRH4_9STRA|nr:hypothetical protein TeGR_g2850 [Tetraparma gracilis]